MGVLHGGLSPEGPPAAGASGERAIPPGHWDRIVAHLRSRSVPTAAMLSQKASLARWEEDGAVVVRLPRPFKEQFDRSPPKLEMLREAITATFGPPAYPRLEVSDGKPPGGGRPSAGLAPAPALARPPAPVPTSFGEGPTASVPPPTPAPHAAWPPAAPPSPQPPAPARPPVSVRKGDEPPPDDVAPPEDDGPPPDRDWEAEAAVPPSQPVAGGPDVHGHGAAEDHAVRLAVEVFNGKVMLPPEP
jgi:hypothetical protein